MNSWGRRGRTVIVPDTAYVYPDETIWVQWGEPGALGAYRTSTDTPANSRRFVVPKEFVAPHVGKTVAVRYDVTGPVTSLTSAIRQLKVLMIENGRLPIIQIEGLVGSRLSLASIPSSGVPLLLGTWVLMATTQRVRIEVTGLTSTGQPARTLVADNRPITDAELATGVRAAIDRHFMTGLKLEATFTLNVYVSFDAGSTWPPVPNFPSNQSITLVA